jgi:hypothetical protein
LRLLRLRLLRDQRSTGSGIITDAITRDAVIADKINCIVARSGRVADLPLHFSIRDENLTAGRKF